MSRGPRPASRRLGTIVATTACGIVAGAVTLGSVSSIGVLPPSIAPRHLEIGGAGARVLVENARPLVSDRLATGGDYLTLQKRAVLIGSLMVSEPVRRNVARLIAVRPEDLVGRARVTANVQAVLTEPESEPRAVAIGEANVPYRLEIHPDPVVPALSIYAQAPTVAGAERLADVVVPATREYLRTLALRSGSDPRQQVVLEQPGRARGAIINGGTRGEILGLTFVFVLALLALVAMAARKLRDDRRLRLAPPTEPRHPLDGEPVRARAPAPGRRRRRERRAPAVSPLRALALTPLVASGPQGTIAAAPLRVVAPERGLAAMSRRVATHAGDWPRTTRVLPWLLAAMMLVVWLVPFNTIELAYSLPVDLKFDRLVLPVIAVVWVLSLAAGGPAAPRLRISWIHVAVGGVAVAALLSLVVGARSLNQALELDTSIKKLTLLASYIALFVMVASSIRRSEVAAFMRYTLVLAVLCALGTIWEYRFSYNIFYSLSDSLLPGIFTVGAPESGAVDAIGRRLVRGPGEVPLEVVAMLAMGLPVAVAGLTQSKQTRSRVLYGLATALILAAAASTERKSALLAPASVFLTLAYFRRRELMRLAPLGVAIAVLMLALTPGAAQSVVGQLSGKQLNAVTTVSDRSSDYDAVRPDVWSHLAFGRGYGSYDHIAYRILDMELLRELVEVGVVGVLAFLLMIGTIVGVARRPIRDRIPDEAAVGLAAASAAVALLVVSTLFDSMAFPHCPYIALWMAGLLAVVVTRDREDRWSS